MQGLKTRSKRALVPPKGYDALHGYQAGETVQVPKPMFPSSLASCVLVFATDDEWARPDMDHEDWLRKVASSHAKSDKADPISYAKLNMQPILDKLRSSDMVVREVMSEDRKHMFALVSVSEKRQRMVAEVMGEHMRVRMKVIDDEGNEVKNAGGWTPFKNDLYPYYEKSSEGLLFSSCQQQYIMEFLLNERDPRAMGPQVMQKEACLPGNSILQQLIADERIVDFFYLHHPDKKNWLLEHWAGTYLRKQPVEDIREYFGEEIALFFVFCGYFLTMLWVLAGVGIFTFAMEMEALQQSGHTANPYSPLFAIFCAIWSINFSAGWRRLEIVYQWEWDTLDYKDPAGDRTDFVQNTRTYKRLNRISQREEYYPDPLWRVIGLVTTVVVVSVLMGLTILVTLILAIVKKKLEAAGMPGMVVTLLGANVQSALILLFRWLAKLVFLFLNDFENWKTDEQYENALISKMFSYAFCNSYFPIIFVAFIANSVRPFDEDVSCGESCEDYLVLLVGVIYVQNAIWNAFSTFLMAKAGEADNKTQVISEFELQPFDATTDEFLTEILELGWVMLFASASPLLPSLALLHHVWLIRSLAGKFLEKFRRPLYSCSDGIGAWTTIIEIQCLMAIVINSCLVAFNSDSLMYYFPNMNEFDRVFYAVALEHLLLAVKVVVDSAVEVPEDVKTACQIKTYQKSILLSKLDIANPEEHVAFYTDDDGSLFYKKQ